MATIAIVLFALAIAIIVYAIRADRRVSAENARRQRDYQQARIRAWRNGEAPPMPPNRVRLG